ncbi:MAG: prolyl aminopeptidase, partial [Oceanisphaera sp.]|nr:prolyl aminopeptidase [Oceanisphaera sp.]
MRTLYPSIGAYRQQWLSVSPRHRLYVEESGNPLGIPVVLVHGGSGAGTSGEHRRFFDPECYRIILFDQRGAGQSE